ncbi:MAG: YfhO family protein, partial [Clostridia bacterium]|nr:YfhO family protein [Clostridia bacterium]
MKIKNFLVKNKDYLLIIATIVVIIFSLFIIKGVFPFGRNTIAHYDMIGQTIPLSELIFDWFKGESPLFYSTSIGLGANTFGYLIYFILSPFNLLILLGGSGNLLFSVSIVFLFKLVTIGCFACWFIKKYFKNVGSLLTIAFSVAYTFCGYMLFNYTYLSFIDYLIYAPIFIYTFTLLKDENKIWPMALIVFLMILSCFSLGCFVLIYLAVIFSAYIFIVVKKEDRKNLILKVIASVLIGLALASPILVPAFWQFLSSARNAGISIFNTAFAVGTATKIGVIITDIVALFFGILYFVKCDKKDSFNKFLISVGVLTLITTFSDESLMMFNGGATFGYYSRFGFVGAIYTLSLACLYFDKIYKPAEKNIKQTSATNYAIVAIYSVIFVLLVFIFKTNLSNIIRSQKLTREALWEYLPIFVMIVIPFLLILFTKKTTGNQLKIVASIFVILVSFGGGVFHITNNVNGTTVYTQTSQVFEQLDKDYRVKFVADNYIALNATTMGVKSLGTFSSLNDKKFNETLTKLGYFHSTNWVKSIGGTLLSDIFVGNKYIFSQSKMDYNHLNLLEEKDGYYLYE